jgi:hypothetical protein
LSGSDRSQASRAWLAAVAALVGATACGSEAPTVTVASRDSVGIRIVEVRASEGPDAETAVWTVYGPTGEAIATIDTPVDLTVLDVDRTHVVGKRTDELGVETIWTYIIER